MKYGLIGMCFSLVLMTQCRSKYDEIVLSTRDDGSIRETLEVYKGSTLQPDSAWYRIYYPKNVAIYKEGLVINKREHDTWTSYYQSGKTQCEIEWIHGVREGLCKCFYESGQIAQKGKYAADELVTVQFFDKLGNEMSHNADMSFLLKDSPPTWRDNELQNIKNDCLMAMESEIVNAKMFCACMAILSSEHCQYEDVKTLPPNQRVNLFSKLIELDSTCLQYYR